METTLSCLMISTAAIFGAWLAIAVTSFAVLRLASAAATTALRGGRIGGAWGQWLLYADGGYAQSRLHASAFNTSTGELLEAAQANSDGWYAGVGIAYAVTPNIVLGAQYTHVVANEVMLTFPDPYINDARTASNRFDMIEFRADFKLWPWSSASSY